MALQIFKGNQAALDVYAKGIGIHGDRRCDVGMGAFAVANNTLKTTALGTSGAGPCQIIVVHKAPGLGALGHYGGDDRPEKIVTGVHRMIQKLGGLPIASIMFAAGSVGNLQRDQLNYEIGVVGSVRSLCAQVVWPTAPQNDVWGACYYLPLEESVGLRTDSPGGFVGMGNDGITLYAY